MADMASWYIQSNIDQENTFLYEVGTPTKPINFYVVANPQVFIGSTSIRSNPSLIATDIYHLDGVKVNDPVPIHLFWVL